jgi:phosphatidate cytidylyltransferase
MKQITSRARTGLLATALLVLCLWKPWLRWLLPVITAVLSFFAAREFHRMSRHAGLNGSLVFTVTATVLLTLCGVVPAIVFSKVMVAAIAVVIMAAFILYMKLYGFEGAVHSVPAIVFGPLYIGLPLALCLQVLQADRMFLIFGMALVWLADTGAYYAGRKYGTHKLAPALSPKKTMEGAVGGLFASVVVGLLFKALVPAITFPYTWLEVVMLGAVVGFLAPAGDLAESVLKRDSGLKDSGRSMGGHGGVLDRLDSMLFCFCAYYIFLVAKGLL